MARATPSAPWQQAIIVLTATVVAVVVVACLYWAQAIFIPLALAAFLTFVLSPVVVRLQHLGLGRTPAVLGVVLLAALVLGGITWLVAAEFTSLVKELPQHSETIKKKIRSLRGGDDGITDRLGKLADEIGKELKTAPPEGATPANPPQVVVQPQGPGWLSRLPSFLTPLVSSLGTAALAGVLLVFMLLKQGDLRNRFIRLVGRGQVTTTTKAIDEAGDRISRFLLTQAALNGSYGVVVAFGLALLGVPYWPLWGFLAAAFRYVPYLGVWAAAVMPVTLSFATSEGWAQPLEVLGLFLAMELITGNAIEPRLFGHSLGISEVALLVAAAFWGFLWGAIGMVLASPMTVCLVVLGKYVPWLHFFEVLLGDEPALSPELTYYQRLVARDQDEAEDLVLAQAREGPPDAVYDALLVPALVNARREREGGELNDDDVRFIQSTTAEILEDLGERQEPPAEGESAPRKARLLACPARGETDRLGLEMLKQLLDPAKWEVTVAGAEALTSEMVSEAAETKPDVICIGSVPPGGQARTRYLCKRLKGRFPGVHLAVARPGLTGDTALAVEALRGVGADAVTTTLLATRDQLNAWLPVLTAAPPAAPEAPARRPAASPVQGATAS